MVICSATWSSQVWRLIIHPGFVIFPYHDCCGLGTYVIGNSGAKIWEIIHPKHDLCPSSLASLTEAFEKVTNLLKEEKFSNVEIVTVCLEESNVM